MIKDGNGIADVCENLLIGKKFQMYLVQTKCFRGNIFTAAYMQMLRHNVVCDYVGVCTKVVLPVYMCTRGCKYIQIDRV